LSSIENAVDPQFINDSGVALIKSVSITTEHLPRETNTRLTRGANFLFHVFSLSIVHISKQTF